MNREPFVQVALGAALVAGDYWHLPFGMVIGALLVIVGGRTWFTTRRAAKEAQKATEDLRAEVQKQTVALVVKHLSAVVAASQTPTSTPNQRGH